MSGRHFPEDHTHYIPLGSLTPAEADNIVAAGRCIDADLAALSSVRVMGPCIAMGAAAAHALDLAGSGSVHQIDIASLGSACMTISSATTRSRDRSSSRGETARGRQAT